MIGWPSQPAVQAELAALTSHHHIAVPLHAATAQAADILSIQRTSCLNPDDAAPCCAGLERVASLHRAVAPRRAPVHPLVLKNAQERSGGRADFYPRPTGGRLALWGLNSTRLLHLTHIAKSGGRSVKDELSKLMRRVAREGGVHEKRVGGAEQCYPPYVHESRVNIVFLREPRSHLLSMYQHGLQSYRDFRKCVSSRRAHRPIGCSSPRIISPSLRIPSDPGWLPNTAAPIPDGSLAWYAQSTHGLPTWPSRHAMASSYGRWTRTHPSSYGRWARKHPSRAQSPKAKEKLASGFPTGNGSGNGSGGLPGEEGTSPPNMAGVAS